MSGKKNDRDKWNTGFERHGHFYVHFLVFRVAVYLVHNASEYDQESDRDALFPRRGCGSVSDRRKPATYHGGRGVLRRVGLCGASYAVCTAAFNAHASLVRYDDQSLHVAGFI